MAMMPQLWDTHRRKAVQLPLPDQITNRYCSVAFDSARNCLHYLGVTWRIIGQPLTMISWEIDETPAKCIEQDVGINGDGLPSIHPLPEGRLLVARGDRLDVYTQEPDTTLVQSWNLSLTGACRTVSQCGRWFAISHDRELRLFDLQLGRLAYSMQSRSLRSPIRAIAISPDGKWLAFAVASYVFVHELDTGRWLETLTGITRHLVQSLVFCPESRYLATSEGQGQSRLWDIPTMQERVLYQWNSRSGRAVAFAPDGLRLAVGSSTGRVIVWDVE